jgi:hypothetical protein
MKKNLKSPSTEEIPSDNAAVSRPRSEGVGLITKMKKVARIINGCVRKTNLMVAMVFQ